MWVTLNLWEALFGRPVWTLLNASPTSHTSVIACSHLPTNVADKICRRPVNQNTPLLSV